MVVLYLVIALLVLFALWLLMIAPRKTVPDAMQELTHFRYAHRGLHNASANIPENSAIAFQKAIDHGYGAELDVHLSKDGRLVVMHDESLKRMCGVEADICDFSYEEIYRCTLEQTDEHPPLLEDILKLFEGKTPLVVELKPCHGNQAILCSETCKVLDRHQVRYCIESFDPRVVFWLRKNRPEIVRGQLSENFMLRKEGQPLLIRFILTNLLTNFLTRPDFVAYREEDRNVISFRLCRKIWRVKEFSWTVRYSSVAKTIEQSNGTIIFEDFLP